MRGDSIEKLCVSESLEEKAARLENPFANQSSTRQERIGIQNVNTMPESLQGERPMP
jgi:hypothetical protein